ncbi:MAG: UbiA family prenyltransferase [Cyclobacteriaceae bacterium]
MKKSTLLHLRIPFSFFLMPVFLFAWSIMPDVAIWRFISVFIILHLLVYPASNGYNSYFDKDEESIGGLKEPPKVSKELYNWSILLDVAALIWACFIDIRFAAFILIYGLVSKAYSHPSVRLKKMPYVGWFAAGFFQGYFTFILTLIGLHSPEISLLTDWSVQLPAILSTLLLFGSYPMTQIYQHHEDARRGDLTISRILGILGTFHFTAGAFFLSSIGFFYYYYHFVEANSGIIFYAALSPVLIYFNVWYLKVRKDRNLADYDKTMMLNLLSAICLNAFFLYQGFSGMHAN